MRIMTVVGARPNFMKAAPIIAAIDRFNRGASCQDAVSRIEHVLVHTGQHYDAAMSDSFFADLNLPAPDIRLGVGPGSHAVQTAEILKKFEEVLLSQKPDVVIVVGDVTSTVACALATAKISFDAAGSRPLLAHVEAGLRSFDRAMPEEVNRVVTDHLADLLFVTEESGVANLRREGVSSDAIHLVGNTMIDSLLAFKDKAETSGILQRLGLKNETAHNGNGARPYGLLTLHRPSNVDNRDTFVNILEGLAESALNCPVVFPVHPRTRRQIAEFGLDSHLGDRSSDSKGHLILTEPLGYLDFLCLMKHAALVVTDSGGIQEETTCLGVPCVTVRENTERPVTLERGTNLLAGTSKERIKAAISRQIQTACNGRMPDKWDGQAAIRIVDLLVRAHRERTSRHEAVLQ